MELCFIESICYMFAPFLQNYPVLKFLSSSGNSEIHSIIAILWNDVQHKAFSANKMYYLIQTNSFICIDYGYKSFY